MRGIRMRFEEQPGLCRKTRQAIPAAIRRGWRSARKSPTPCSTPMTCCATPEGTERQEEDVAQDLGGLQEYRRITPMALFALQAAADAGEPRVRLNPWRDWPPRRGSARRLRLHVAEHRLQAEQAGIAQGAQFVEADAGEDFHAAQQSARRRACSSSLARPARALAPTVEALPLMVCRVAALPWTSPSPSWRSSWAKRSCMSGTKRRNTWTISSRLPPKRPTISPRASTSSPASAAVAGAPRRRSCRDDRAGKAPGAPCRSASPHGRSCPPPGGFAVGQRGVGGHGGIGSPAKRPSARILRVASRPSISGICMSISTASNGTLASSTC